MASAVQTAHDEVRRELATQVLQSFGGLRFAALGSSMIPAIYPEDILLVRRQPAANVRRGQVVLASRGGRFYAHRVVGTVEERGEKAWITRGDALREDDPPFSESDVLGVVSGVIRRGRKIKIAERPAPPTKCLRWCVRNSDTLTVALLRWHQQRNRRWERRGGMWRVWPGEVVDCL